MNLVQPSQPSPHVAAVLQYQLLACWESPCITRSGKRGVRVTSVYVRLASKYEQRGRWAVGAPMATERVVTTNRNGQPSATTSMSTQFPSADVAVLADAAAVTAAAVRARFAPHESGGGTTTPQSLMRQVALLKPAGCAQNSSSVAGACSCPSSVTRVADATVYLRVL